MQYIDGMDDEVLATISPFLTVHGNNLININTAELPVLVSLHEDMTGILAEKVVDFREITPFQETIKIINVSGFQSIGTVIQQYITVKSSHFRVVTQAEVNGTVRTVESVTDTSMKVHLWREG
jgi:general secretion pathway protein K